MSITSEGSLAKSKSASSEVDKIVILAELGFLARAIETRNPTRKGRNDGSLVGKVRNHIVHHTEAIPIALGLKNHQIISRIQNIRKKLDGTSKKDPLDASTVKNGIDCKAFLQDLANNYDNCYKTVPLGLLYSDESAVKEIHRLLTKIRYFKKNLRFFVSDISKEVLTMALGFNLMRLGTCLVEMKKWNRKFHREDMGKVFCRIMKDREFSESLQKLYQEVQKECGSLARFANDCRHFQESDDSKFWDFPEYLLVKLIDRWSDGYDETSSPSQSEPSSSGLSKRAISSSVDRETKELDENRTQAADKHLSGEEAREEYSKHPGISKIIAEHTKMPTVPGTPAPLTFSVITQIPISQRIQGEDREAANSDSDSTVLSIVTEKGEKCVKKFT